MIKIKLIKKDDLEIIKRIAIRAFKDDLKKYGCKPLGIEKNEWHLSKIKNGHYYKIISNDKIVGAFKIYTKKNKCYHLGSIFINPKYHNQGIGSYVMRYIESKFDDFSKITLDTPYKNFKNHYFYEKFGYKKINEIKPNSDSSFKLFVYEKAKKL